MDLRERRQLNKEMGDGLSRAFELVLTPMVAAGIGLLLDRWLGWTPILTVVFAVWAVSVTMFTTWRQYDTDMRRHEDERASLAAASGRPGAPARRIRERSIANRIPEVGALDG